MVSKVRFTIDESGEVQISVEGAQGKSCEAMTAPFESQLGIVRERTYKDSYFTTTESTEETHLERGLD